MQEGGPATGVIFENDYHAVHGALRGTYTLPAVLSGLHGAPIFSAGRRHTGVGFHHHHESWLAQLIGRKAGATSKAMHVFLLFSYHKTLTSWWWQKEVWFLLPPGSPRPPAVPPWWCTLQPPAGLQLAILEPGEVSRLLSRASLKSKIQDLKRAALLVLASDLCGHRLANR